MLQSEAGDVNTAMKAWFYGAFEGCAGVFVREMRAEEGNDEGGAGAMGRRHRATASRARQTRAFDSGAWTQMGGE